MAELGRRAVIERVERREIVDHLLRVLVFPLPIERRREQAIERRAIGDEGEGAPGRRFRFRRRAAAQQEIAEILQRAGQFLGVILEEGDGLAGLGQRLVMPAEGGEALAKSEMAVVRARGDFQRLLEIWHGLGVFPVPEMHERIHERVVEFIAHIAGAIFGEGKAPLEGVAIALIFGDEAKAKMFGDLGVDRRNVVAAVRVARIERVQPRDQLRLDIHAPEQFIDQKEGKRAPEMPDGGEKKLLPEILADILGDAIAAGLIPRLHRGETHLQPAVELGDFVDILVEIALDALLGRYVLFQQPVEIEIATLAIIRAVTRDMFVIVILGMAEAAIGPINTRRRQIRDAVDFGLEVEILDIGFLLGVELLRDDDIGGNQEIPVALGDILIRLDITRLLLAKWQDVVAVGAIDCVDLTIPEKGDSFHPILFS